MLKSTLIQRRVPAGMSLYIELFQFMLGQKPSVSADKCTSEVNKYY